jgi:hypothetical protein
MKLIHPLIFFALVTSSSVLGAEKQRSLWDASGLKDIKSIEIVLQDLADVDAERPEYFTENRDYLYGVRNCLEQLPSKQATTGPRTFPREETKRWLVKIMDSEGEWIALTIHGHDLQINMSFNIGNYGSVKTNPKIADLIRHIESIQELEGAGKNTRN